MIWDNQHRSVAVALDRGNVESGETSDRAWIGLLRQYFGSTDVLDLDEVLANPRQQLGARRILFVPKDASRAHGHGLAQQLTPAVEAGLTVVFIQPDSNLAPSLGLRLGTVETRPLLPWPFPRSASRAFTQGVGLPEPSIELATSAWRYAPGTDRSSVARPIVSPAGRASVWVRSQGMGAFVTMSHDLAAMAVGLAARRGASPTFDAWLDAWAEALLADDAFAAPTARWALAPPDDDGWLLLTPPTDSADSLLRELEDRIWGLVVVDADRDSPVDFDSILRGTGLIEAGPLVLRSAQPWPDDLDPRGRRQSDISHFLAWQAEREDATLHWHVEHDRLIVKVETGSTQGLDQALRIPLRWRGRRLVDWKASWAPARSRRVHGIDADALLISVPSGVRGNLMARYSAPLVTP